ncbi:sigma-70 family RNA polymerase sigma factor [candidate division KSB1 bacterium]|nr:sigma-70 family RNA polymerase sigma factor [candidate division KSB1 bacterium]
MTQDHENKLIKKIRAGDRTAEQELFSNFDSRIERKVRYTIGFQNEDWKDVVCDIQLALLDSLRCGKFDTEKGISLGSYTYGITMNKIRDYFKHQKKRENIMSDPLEKDLCAMDPDEVEDTELRDTLKKLILKLKLKYKEILYLRFYEELAISEISQRIGLPPRRVSERINYAVKLLRKECKKEKDFSIFLNILITI